MRIRCPLCGERDAQEFSYRGDARPTRPAGEDRGTEELGAMTDYVHLRENPAGPLPEHWYHGAGCHAWLVVTRDTRTHAITNVVAAADARRAGEAA